MIRFGPTGLGASVEKAAISLERYHKLGIKACEIPFTYGIFIKEDKHKKEIEDIRNTARKLDIKLSIHAPYWLNLNSKEKKKIDESKKRILQCCKIGELLGVEIVVFHAGFYDGMSREQCYQNIKRAILEIMDKIKKNKWKIKVAPETMGKINVFGEADEILRLVKETKCEFCLDFAHLYARNIGKLSYKEIYEKFKQFKKLHCHFSGINFGSRGEINHKITPESEIKKLLYILPKNKDITIINESPDPLGDSLKSLRILKKI
ncbi:MAG: TIM barrel protein [Candidatus Pacearchaeota archaeon]